MLFSLNKYREFSFGPKDLTWGLRFVWEYLIHYLKSYSSVALCHGGMDTEGENYEQGGT